MWPEDFHFSKQHQWALELNYSFLVRSVRVPEVKMMEFLFEYKKSVFLPKFFPHFFRSNQHFEKREMPTTVCFTANGSWWPVVNLLETLAGELLTRCVSLAAAVVHQTLPECLWFTQKKGGVGWQLDKETAPHVISSAAFSWLIFPFFFFSLRSIIRSLQLWPLTFSWQKMWALCTVSRYW